MTTLARQQLAFQDSSGHSIAPADAPHPLAILQSAVERGAPIDTLERISALAREWKADDARQRYAEAMAALQAQLPVVVADKVNSHTNSKYPALETVEKVLQPLRLKHGFTVTVHEDGPPVDGAMQIVAIVRHIGGHVESFRRFVPPDTTGPGGKANKTGLQGAQSSVSYISRRLRCEIFGLIVAGEDKDGNAGTNTPVTTDQMAELNALMKAKGVEVERFLKWAEVDSLSELTQGKYKAAIPMLNAKKPVVKD